MREIFCVGVCVMGANIFHHWVLAISVGSWQFAWYLWHFQLRTRALSTTSSFARTHNGTNSLIHLHRTSFSSAFAFKGGQHKWPPHFFVMWYALAVGRKAATKQKSDADIFAWCDKITVVFVCSSILSSCVLFKLVWTCVHAIYGKPTMSTRNIYSVESFSSVQRAIYITLYGRELWAWKRTNEWMNEFSAWANGKGMFIKWKCFCLNFVMVSHRKFFSICIEMKYLLPQYSVWNINNWFCFDELRQWKQIKRIFPPTNFIIDKMSSLTNRIHFNRFPFWAKETKRNIHESTVGK